VRTYTIAAGCSIYCSRTFGTFVLERYKMECTRCPGTVLSVLYMRACNHTLLYIFKKLINNSGGKHKEKS
jgi:hypothetical protein